MFNQRIAYAYAHNKMTPIEFYHSQCSEGSINEDPQQLHVLSYLQKIYDALIAEHRARGKLLAKWRKPKLIHGLYVWGGVGIGKTFVMDCFYECIPFKEKMRMHFHAFMQMVHRELRHHQGEQDPLKKVAQNIAKKTMLLCFDEFVVNDIADAMILRRLLEALFAAGVCLVATSNVVPDELYKKGLQRALFLPAIALIKQHTDVVHVSTTIDYRLQHLQEAGVYYYPDDANAAACMEESFALLTEGMQLMFESIMICDRMIAIIKQAQDIIWFDFNVICKPPRSQHDYLELVKHYKTIFISHVPVIHEYEKDTINLFIRMVDVFYDARVRLVLSAACAVDQLYVEGDMLSQFTRTRSRLLEMQSADYFANQS